MTRLKNKSEKFKTKRVVYRDGAQEWLYKGQLHRENDQPAIVYVDGTQWWYKWGVKIPKWLATTDSKDLEIEEILVLKNAQQRAVGVRLYGVERFWHKKAKIIDNWKSYELGLLPINGKDWPYLKMQNPSVPELWHVEGVPEENCRNAKEAFHLRKPPRLRKIPVSENGQNWYQQGDVCIWPKNAKFVKFFPKILT